MTLKELRQAKKLSQKEVADALGVGRSTVAMWENGSSFPKVEMFPAIAEILDVKVGVLFDSLFEAARF